MSRPARVFPVRPHDQTTPTPRCIFFLFPLHRPRSFNYFLGTVLRKIYEKNDDDSSPERGYSCPSPPPFTTDFLRYRDVKKYTDVYRYGETARRATEKKKRGEGAVMIVSTAHRLCAGCVSERPLVPFRRPTGETAVVTGVGRSSES